MFVCDQKNHLRLYQQIILIIILMDIFSRIFFNIGSENLWEIDKESQFSFEIIKRFNYTLNLYKL